MTIYLTIQNTGGYSLREKKTDIFSSIQSKEGVRKSGYDLLNFPDYHGTPPIVYHLEMTVT